MSAVFRHSLSALYIPGLRLAPRIVKDTPLKSKETSNITVMSKACKITLVITKYY